jgi:DNA-directed RNA polymerase specialized sigma24 family protein
VHAETAVYYDACCYAQTRLPDAETRFKELWRQRHEPLDDLKLKIDHWAREGFHAYPPRPLSGDPPPPPVPPRWEPCKHFGGERICPLCEREAAELDQAITEIQAIADGLASPELKTLSGTMAHAQRIWERYHKFVRARLWAELRPYTQGGQPYCRMDEVESQVWMNVAAKIGGYTDRGTPMAWLTTVVHSTVNDWFKTEFRQCRDARLTDSLPTSDQPVPSGGRKPALDNEPPEVQAARAAYDASLGREWRRDGGGANR